MRCPICNAPMAEEELDYKTEVSGQEVLLEAVPTWVCPQCDERIVDPTVETAVEDLLAGLVEGLGDEEFAPEDAADEEEL